MVLHPISHVGSEPVKNSVSAWDAVEARQKQKADAWLLVAQPDHAALAGDLAAGVCWPNFPSLSPEILHAIRLHDSGWSYFDGGGARGAGALAGLDVAPKLTATGRPASFLEMQPSEFFRAWVDSIEQAAQVVPIGGIMVSEHFCRLAQSRLKARIDKPQDTHLIGEFLAQEGVRQEQLSRQDNHSELEKTGLVDALQFCDLLSLYLCCGSHAAVEFPQRFAGQAIQLRREGEVYRSEPALFGQGLSLGVMARRFPTATVEPASATIPFLLM